MKKNIRFIGLVLGMLIAFPVFAQNNSSDSSPYAAALALKNFEEHLNSTTNPEQRFYLINKIAPTAFVAGDLEKAKSYSNTLLSIASIFAPTGTSATPFMSLTLCLDELRWLLVTLPQQRPIYLNPERRSGRRS